MDLAFVKGDTKLSQPETPMGIVGLRLYEIGFCMGIVCLCQREIRFGSIPVDNYVPSVHPGGE